MVLMLNSLPRISVAFRYEIVVIVTEIGEKVVNFKVRDKVSLGCLVGSCCRCNQCVANLENYCHKQILTYGGAYFDETVTYGGYSDIMVAEKNFVIRWPENLPLDVGAPLVCVGITTYNPLSYFELDKPRLKVGVVGLGGLGHLAVKFVKAFRTLVTVISTSISKKRKLLTFLVQMSF